MSTTRVRIDPDNPATLPEGRFDPAVVDGTTEAEVARQQQEDDAEAMQDMARYARRVRAATGAARALLRVLDKAPEAALRVLT